jgi:hypothetical protein
MQSGQGRVYGGLWRDRLGGRKLGEWRRRASWPLLGALALCAVHRFVPALALDDWLRSAGELLSWPARWLPRPDPSREPAFVLHAAPWNGVADARARLRAAEVRATAPRGRVVLDEDEPERAAESLPPPSRFVEVLAKPGGGARWLLAARRVEAEQEAREIDVRGAIALWRQTVVGRVARETSSSSVLELVLSSTKGQRFPVVYRGANGEVGSGVLVAGPFATPSGGEAAFRLLHPTCDPLSPDEPLRLSAGPDRYRASIRRWSSGGELGEEARQLEVAEGFVVARFRALRSFADGWFADAVIDPEFVHGVHLAGVLESACEDLAGGEPRAALVRDAADLDVGERSAGLDGGAHQELARGDAVLARGRLVGELAAVTPWSSRVRSLDVAGRSFEALLLTADGELRQLGRLRSLGLAHELWILEPDEPLPAALTGELFSGAAASPGWKGLPLGMARVANDGRRLELLPREWSLGETLAVVARGGR